MNYNVRSLRSPAFSFILSRRVAVFRKTGGFSEDFIRISASALGTVCLFFFVVSLFFFWNIGREKASIVQQQTVRESLVQEKAELKDRRDELLAKPRLVALAAAQLDLHLPEKDQEHNLY